MLFSDYLLHDSLYPAYHSGDPLLIRKTEKPMTEDIVSDITEALKSGKELEGLVRDMNRHVSHPF